jgi:hypothetical protein
MANISIETTRVFEAIKAYGPIRSVELVGML